MGSKRFWLACLVVFVAYVATGFLIHGFLLGSTYRELASIWRPEGEMNQRFPWMLLGQAIFAVFFCLVYAKGVEGKGWVGEGFRYGLIAATLIGLPAVLTQWVVYPIPGSLAIKWVMYGYMQIVILGLCAAAIYRKQP